MLATLFRRLLYLSGAVQKQQRIKRVIRRIVLSNKSLFKRNSLLGVTYYKIG